MADTAKKLRFNFTGNGDIHMVLHLEQVNESRTCYGTLASIKGTGDLKGMDLDLVSFMGGYYIKLHDADALVDADLLEEVKLDASGQRPKRGKLSLG